MQLTKEYFDKQLNKLASKEDLKGFATKDDIKRFATKEDLKGFATKDDLKEFATKGDLKGFATKDDLRGFANKDDLKRFATKDDLRGFANKDDLKAQTAELIAYTDEKVADKVEELAVMVAHGFEDIKSRLDVRERVSALEHDMTRIKKSLLVD